MSIELEPCPFCNGAAKYSEAFNRNYVECTNSRCWLQGVMASPSEWNTRAPVVEQPDDCPEFDATDAAHPAWWRGHEHTAKIFCLLVNEILDGKQPTGGISNEPWEATKKRLYELAAPKRESVTRDDIVEAIKGFHKPCDIVEALLSCFVINRIEGEPQREVDKLENLLCSAIGFIRVVRDRPEIHKDFKHYIDTHILPAFENA